MTKFDLDHLDDWRIKEIMEGGYYILPAHKTPIRKLKNETVNYWTVTITLTSGEVKQFYIKARTKEDALEKAKSYKYLSLIDYPKKFGFMP